MLMRKKTSTEGSGEGLFRAAEIGRKLVAEYPHRSAYLFDRQAS